MSASRGKTSSKAETPAGTANTIQGAAVLGYGHGDAANHPTITWVIK
jgi:hypothetical protein